MQNNSALPNFPYRLKFTRTQTQDLMARIERLRFALTDLVGLSGFTIALDEGSIANIAGHLALAGADIYDDRAFIWGERIADESGVWAAQVRWHVKKETPPPEGASTTQAVKEAAQIAGQIERQFDPEVKRALARELSQWFTDETRQDGDQ